jgi:DNA-directed RNA polymerase subunit K/omega
MKHTRFERARIIGARALQINMGAPPLVKRRGNVPNAVDIAELEYASGVIPINTMRI